MKDSTTGEISNLFQELIVSKIKDEIDVLKGEIDEIKESSGICEEKVEKLPKSSSIRQIVEGEQTKVLDLINNLAKDSKSEKYLRDIVAYLKKQYSFSEQYSWNPDIGQMWCPNCGKKGIPGINEIPINIFKKSIWKKKK